MTEPADDVSEAIPASPSELSPAADRGLTAQQAQQVRAAQKRFDRVELLNEELDRLTVDAGDRTLSVTNKASFLAVSAGVLVAATTSQLWTRFQGFGVASLIFACLGLLCAAVALRPGHRYGILAQRLTDSYLDSTKLAQDIKAKLVETKSEAITRRERDLTARAEWVWAGFGALVLSTVALSIVFSAQLLGG